MADFGVRAHDALRLVAEKMHRAALRHVGSTIRVGGVARGVVGHRVDRAAVHDLSLIHISEPTRQAALSRMPSSA